MASALEGIRILDLTRFLPFGYCTMLLADLGADVLKIEEPKIGDEQRQHLPKLKKEGVVFLLVNRNKKSMKLNLKTVQGVKILHQLVEKYDVLFESFRPGTMDRLGLGYDNLKEINPRLIYCSATGYGQDGPYKNSPGHDINYIGLTGILGKTGRYTIGHPVVPGVLIADMASGLFSAFAILAGLMARERTGKGQYIDLSMIDCMVSFNTQHIANYIAGFGEWQEGALGLTGETAYYNVYATKDGKYLCLGNLEERFWENLCKIIGRQDLIEYQFSGAQKQKEIMRELSSIFLGRTRDEWLELMRDEDICVGPVNSVEEVLADPHILHRGMILEVEHPVEGKIPQIGFPIKFSETPGDIRTPAPTFGQHTDQILNELGYRAWEIEGLKESGII